MADEIKIRLVSTHDDTGYKQASANARNLSKNVGDAVKNTIDKAKKANNAMSDAAKSSLDTMKNSAGAANVAIQTAQGNIIGATNAIVEMGGRCKALQGILQKIGSVRLGVIGIIVAAVWALKSAIDAAKEAADKMVHEAQMRKLEQWGKLINAISERWKDVEESINRSAKAQDRWTKNSRELDDARSELAKAKEIREAGGDANKIRDIEARYAEMASANKYERELKDQETQKERIEEQLKELGEAKKALAKVASDIALDITKGEITLDIAKNGGSDEEIKRAEESLNKLYELRNTRNSERKNLTDKTNTLMNDYLAANDSISHLKEMRKVELQMEAEARRKTKEDDARALAEKEAKEKKAIEEKVKKEKEIQEKKLKEEQEKKLKAAQDLEKEKQRLEAETRAKALQETIRGYREELKEKQALQSSAQSRLAQAQNASAQAWGWYRDKNKLKSVLKEEADNAKAETQFQREFERLKSFRYDWRTANAYGSGKMHSLSLEEEAVRRVALAREEEAEAKKAVIESRDAVVWIQEHLEQIEGMKE